MHRLFAKLGLMLMTLAHVANSLDCPDPKTVKCEEKSVVEANCTYGVAKDMCDHCWICRKGFGKLCGGLDNMDGTCAEELYCSNTSTGDGEDNPGICCRKSPPPGFQTTTKRQLCPQVRNPCSLEIECEKNLGEQCGGPGNLKGLCTNGLECLPLIVHEISGLIVLYYTCQLK